MRLSVDVMWLSRRCLYFGLIMVVYIYFGHDRVKGLNVPLPSREALPNLYEQCTIEHVRPFTTSTVPYV